MGVTFISREKKSNQKKRAAGREPVLRTGPLRSSARRGAVRRAAERGSALQNRTHLFALAGPAVLGSLEGGPNSRALIRCRGFERSDRLLSLPSCSISWWARAESARTAP